jgi:hypothetical protein
MEIKAERKELRRKENDYKQDHKTDEPNERPGRLTRM